MQAGFDHWSGADDRGDAVLNVNRKFDIGSILNGEPKSGDNPVKQAKKNSTNAQTTISAMDGQTVVFAGLITEQKETVNRSIPFLNKIPVIKHFFEYDSQTCNRTELLIVMTPTIIRTQDDLQLLKQQETSRMHWCINDVVRMTGNSNMRLRSDEWTPDEIRYRPGQTIILNDSQLPAESEIPVPTLAPAEIEN
ncbi:hypothetical protein FACS1894189_2110 [Planctomycetales bacterium]|nr:hypothetical protein FACS1894189_2110 [Planctomycetales bacterium]